MVWRAMVVMVMVVVVLVVIEVTRSWSWFVVAVAVGCGALPWVMPAFYFDAPLRLPPCCRRTLRQYAILQHSNWLQRGGIRSRYADRR